MAIDLNAALTAFGQAGISIQDDFHALHTSQVEVVVALSKQAGYRKPKNANGSTGRCYFEALQRIHVRQGGSAAPKDPADALHEKGLFAVLGPDGEPVTIGSTGWSTRAEFLRQQHANWTKATEKGFRLVKLQILETISPTR